MASAATPGDPAPLARAVYSLLLDRGLTLAVAESLTGGLLAASIVEVPGASRVFRGSVTAYATEVKAAVLGVDRELLERRGAVDPDVARAMAAGVRGLLRADVGLATTGVAGPEPQDGRPPGTVFVALDAAPGVVPAGMPAASDEAFALDGDRAAVRAAAVIGALELLRRNLGGASPLVP